MKKSKQSCPPAPQRNLQKNHISYKHASIINLWHDCVNKNSEKAELCFPMVPVRHAYTWELISFIRFLNFQLIIFSHLLLLVTNIMVYVFFTLHNLLALLRNTMSCKKTWISLPGFSLLSAWLTESKITTVILLMC